MKRKFNMIFCGVPTCDCDRVDERRGSIEI